MNKLLITLLFIFATHAHAAQKAVTEDGEIVILNKDGTWAYQDVKATKPTKIKLDKKKYTKSKHSTFSVKSTNNSLAVWIDPKKWAFKKSDDTSSAEYEFRLKDKDLYGMAITEEIEVDLDNLAAIALQNAKEAAPDSQIVFQEYRMVNGIKVLHMQINGTIQGIKFSYVGYYHSNEKGSTQLITYTATNLVDKYKDEIYTFLNGFSV